LLGDLRLAESEETTAGRELERLLQEMRSASSAREELHQLSITLRPLGRLRAELVLLDQLAREEGRRQTLEETERSVTRELSQLRSRVEHMDAGDDREVAIGTDLAAARSDLAGIEERFEARRTEWVRDRQEAETKRQALREQYTELKAQRERLVQAGEEGSCPTCARPLGGHFRSVLDLLDEQLETIRVDGAYYRGRIEQLATSPEELSALEESRRSIAESAVRLERSLAQVQLQKQELERVRREIEEKERRHATLRSELEALPRDYDAARHRVVQEEAARLQPLEVRAASLGAQLERQRDVEVQRAAAEAHLSELRERVSALAAARDAIAVPEAAVAALRAEYDAAVAELRGAELSMVAAESELEAASAARDSALQNQRDVAKAQRQLEDLERERRLHDELDRSYADLRTDLNQSLRPELSEVASRLMIELTDGRYGELELDDQYNVVVLEDGIPKPVISGGEEDLANLVLRLAISQMIADRAGQNFSLLILDEIFGSLDEARRHNVVDLLRRLHDRFDQVVLITHIDSVREGLDQVVLVRYDEDSGGSTVERAAQERLDAEAAIAVLEGASLEGVL
jgi:DNA repair protein SbcC/Rad50